VWVVNATHRPLYPQERPGTDCIGGWVGPRAGLDGRGKSHPPPGFDLRTIQSVKSRYTDWAIRAMTSNKVKKVKFTLLQVLRLCTGRTAHRVSRGIALLFLDHGTRRVWGVRVTTRPLFTPGNYPVPIVQEAVWDPGLVRTGTENLVPTGIRSPDHTARSQSPYRLSYPSCPISCGNSKLGVVSKIKPPSSNKPNQIFSF